MALNADVMRQHLINQSESQQTVANYCEENDLSVASYYYWRRKLSEDNTAAQHVEAGFNQIIARAEDLAPRIILPSGLEFEVSGMDSPNLAALILELDRAYA